MLKISANTDNTIWVNASRNKTLSSPTYLMSLQHKVSGEKKYFIPQNRTNVGWVPASDTNNVYPVLNDPRVDLFKFGVYESDENLTGGTRAFTYKVSPTLINPNASPTNEIYIYQNRKNSTTGEFGVYFDGIVFGESVFQVKFWFNDVELDSSDIVIRDYGNGNQGGAYMFDGSTNPEYREVGEWRYRIQTTLGRAFEGEMYIASWYELNQEPWDDINYPEPQGIPGGDNTNYPLVYVGTTNISLENSGWYYYRIYEQTSRTNLNPLFTTDVVDEGTLYLYPAPPDEVSYEGYSTGDIVIYDDDNVSTNHILQENDYHLLTENNELLTQE